MNKSPVIEHLESRQLLNGVVQAIVSGNNLTLRGDALDNGIVSVERNAEAITITPDATTSIDGQPVNTPVLVIVPDIQFLRLRMGAGNDAVTITGREIYPAGLVPLTVPKGIQADLGGGDDSLSLVGVFTYGSLTVDVGGGVNSVSISDLASHGVSMPSMPTLVEGNFRVQGHGGDDALIIRGVRIGGTLSVDLGNGDNSFTMAPGGQAGYGRGSQICRNLLYYGGSGTDNITISSAYAAVVLVAGSARFALGGGQDWFTVEHDPDLDLAGMCVDGRLVVAGHGGDKHITLLDMAVIKGVDIRTGSGNDSIGVRGVLDQGTMDIITGRGNDTVTIGRGRVWSKTNIDGWLRVTMTGASATLNMADITGGHGAVLHGGHGVNTLFYDRLSVHFQKPSRLINFVM